jgi:hypothetical protein
MAEAKVDVFIPRGYANDDPNLFVSVNGKNYLLPKGKTSKVPKHVAEEIERSLRAEGIQSENSEKLLEKAKRPIEM